MTRNFFKKHDFARYPVTRALKSNARASRAGMLPRLPGEKMLTEFSENVEWGLHALHHGSHLC